MFPVAKLELMQAKWEVPLKDPLQALLELMQAKWEVHLKDPLLALLDARRAAVIPPVPPLAVVLQKIEKGDAAAQLLEGLVTFKVHMTIGPSVAHPDLCVLTKF